MAKCDYCVAAGVLPANETTRKDRMCEACKAAVEKFRADFDRLSDSQPSQPRVYRSPLTEDRLLQEFDRNIERRSRESTEARSLNAAR